MSRPRVAAVALVAGACLMVAADAGAAVSISAEPSLYPEFRTGTLDYVVRCYGSDRVRFSVAAPEGTTVRVGSSAARGGDFDVGVPLAPGEQVEIGVGSGSGTRRHHVRCLDPGFPLWTAERSGAAEARWYVVTPIRLGYRKPGRTIVFDRNGVPVWWMRDPKGSPFTGTMLPDGGIAWFPYVGTPYGIDPNRFEEHALDGSLKRTFATRGSPTDHHELQVLPNGHAVLASYRPRDHVDLRRLHPSLPSDATVVDGVVQEIDGRGRVVWSWTTRGHIALAEAARWHRVKPLRLRDGRMAYDVVHLNSADVHGDRVVVSLRHTDAVYEIDKRTGKIVWKLGGTSTGRSLTFVDDPLGAESFGGQHDPRETPDGRHLTLFDNGTLRDRPPRAVRYAIDRTARTATLLESVSDAEVRRSACCGGARLLPGGHWAIAWGGDFVMTETDSRGRRILSLAFGGERQSYRVDPIVSKALSTSDFRRGMDAQVPSNGVGGAR